MMEMLVIRQWPLFISSLCGEAQKKDHHLWGNHFSEFPMKGTPSFPLAHLLWNLSIYYLGGQVEF